MRVTCWNKLGMHRSDTQYRYQLWCWHFLPDRVSVRREWAVREHCVLWLSVASSPPFCARDAHKRFVPLCNGAFHILLHNESLIIALLVLSYDRRVQERLLITVMKAACCCLHYCAKHLKDMSFNFIVYIYI